MYRIIIMILHILLFFSFFLCFFRKKSLLYKTVLIFSFVLGVSFGLFIALSGETRGAKQACHRRHQSYSLWSQVQGAHLPLPLQ